jgi:hypothetical protein
MATLVQKIAQLEDKELSVGHGVLLGFVLVPASGCTLEHCHK